MRKIDCKAIAAKIKDDVKNEIDKLKDLLERNPKLAIIQVGNDYASTKYVGNKLKACEYVGINSEHIIMDESSTTLQVLKEISRLNDDESVDGIIVQLPLPKHIDENIVTQFISPNKDVDCLTVESIGAMYLSNNLDNVLAPCTPAGIMEMFKSELINLRGKSVLMIGRSNIVGKPLASLLTKADATVTLAHSHSEYYVNNYDIVISAIGKPKHIVVNNDKAILVDVGINFLDGKMVGDFDIEKCNCKAYTSVPGGVGQLTVAMVCSNVFKLYTENLKIKQIERL